MRDLAHPGDAAAVRRAEASPDFARLNLVGTSPPFVQSLDRIRRMAGCDATVLIEGETGTGKELAARAIHYLGSRRNAPFVPINCGAIPESLVESELFGHARGAFTDAREARAGIVAQAESGTLFLDEIEALGARAQVALLRFLNDHEYRPVGGAARGANVRVIAASNAVLAESVARGGFRQDLLFRLNVLSLPIPPLRSRGDDVILLADTFIGRYCAQYRKPLRRLSAAAATSLRRHAWPGNVRELENVIHREVLLDDGPELRLEVLEGDAVRAAGPSPTFTGQPFREAKASVIARFERAYLAELLATTGGNISLAARIAGKERSRLGKLVKKHGLDPAVFRDQPRDAA